VVARNILGDSIASHLCGTEWAATGKVTQAVPRGFPLADKTSVRKP